MRITPVLLAGAFALSTGNLWAASGREDSIERLRMSTETLHAMINTPDKGIPEEVLNDAKCIVVVPNLVKGGFVFGAEHGRGIATCRTHEGWSAPAFVSIGGGSWGLQIGVEEVDLVMLVMNDRGLQHLLSSKFELSGEGAVAAGPVGRQAVAGTDWKLNTEMLSYSRTKGIFGGLTLEGAVVEQDNDSTWAIYDHEPSFRHVLSGAVPVPGPAGSFLKEVSFDSARAHDENK